MSELTAEQQVSEQIFKAQVEATLNSMNFIVPQSKQLVLNDVIARNRTQPILQPISGFIEKEYAPFLKPIEQSFTSKQDVYDHLIRKGIDPGTKIFYDQYGMICKASKLM